MSTQPKGMARAALEREGRRSTSGLQGVPKPAAMPIDIMPLPDGRARQVDRRTRQQLGTAVNARQAGRTRDFFL